MTKFIVGILVAILASSIISVAVSTRLTAGPQGTEGLQGTTGPQGPKGDTGGTGATGSANKLSNRG